MPAMPAGLGATGAAGGFLKLTPDVPPNMLAIDDRYGVGGDVGGTMGAGSPLVMPAMRRAIV